jgi:hypothetical protein
MLQYYRRDTELSGVSETMDISIGSILAIYLMNENDVLFQSVESKSKNESLEIRQKARHLVIVIFFDILSFAPTSIIVESVMWTAIKGIIDINAIFGDIAVQANILSMNASIEAVHAGNFGKESSIVAT